MVSKNEQWTLYKDFLCAISKLHTQHRLAFENKLRLCKITVNSTHTKMMVFSFALLIFFSIVDIALAAHTKQWVCSLAMVCNWIGSRSRGFIIGFVVAGRWCTTSRDYYVLVATSVIYIQKLCVVVFNVLKNMFEQLLFKCEKLYKTLNKFKWVIWIDRSTSLTVFYTEQNIWLNVIFGFCSNPIFILIYWSMFLERIITVRTYQKRWILNS